MQFPDPRTAPCRSCGSPTVLAQIATGAVRVHCGTWRQDCYPTADPGVPEPGPDQD